MGSVVDGTPVVDFTYFRDEIVKACRQRAMEIADADYGTIAITLNPPSDAIRRWMGWKGLDGETDLKFTLKVGGTHTRPVGWRDRPYSVQCSGFASLKIAACSYAVKHGYGYRSSDMPSELIEKGAVKGCANAKGAIAFEVWRFGKYHNDDLGGEFFFRIYVCVSGLSEEEDDACAAAAILPIMMNASGFEDEEWTYSVKTADDVMGLV